MVQSSRAESWVTKSSFVLKKHQVSGQVGNGRRLDGHWPRLTRNRWVFIPSQWIDIEALGRNARSLIITTTSPLKYCRIRINEHRCDPKRPSGTLSKVADEWNSRRKSIEIKKNQFSFSWIFHLRWHSVSDLILLGHGNGTSTMER